MTFAHTENGKKVLTMAEYFAGGHLRFVNGEWRDDDGNLIEIACVRHGRWIDKGEYAICMECGVRSGTQYDGVEPTPLMTQFCPNCGAKMDGGKNDS